MIKIFLSFDFYGSGNIGDDLMLGGFLQGLKGKNYEIYCSIPRDSVHQQKRFPEINFVEFKNRVKVAGECKVWAGVGDTPIQVKSGEWFLQKLIRDSAVKAGKNIQYYFIGIGAEREAVSEKDNFMKAIEGVDHFWTRDKSTTEVLVNEFGIRSDKVSTSSDLANISLSKIFNPDISNNNFKYDLGVCYYDENIEEGNLQAIKSFLKKSGMRKKKLLFGNDVSRKGIFEYKLYRKLFSGMEKILNNIRIYEPDFQNSTNLNDLVKHYSQCDVIMTSRYHSVLTAAWAGCRIIVLERSSKVSALAEELGIKEVKKPFTHEKLLESFNEAGIVSRNLLNEFLKNAIHSVDRFEELIIKN